MSEGVAQRELCLMTGEGDGGDGRYIFNIHLLICTLEILAVGEGEEIALSDLILIG